METWQDKVNAVNFRPASRSDYSLYDRFRRYSKEPTITKPLAEHESWTELAEPAVSQEAIRPWSPRLAVKNLEVTQIEFEEEGREKWVQGYATGRKFAIRPNAKQPLRTAVHELAHIALAHTFAPDPWGRSMDSPIREVQAETTSFLVMTYAGAATKALEAIVRVYNRIYIAEAKQYMSSMETDQCFEAAEIIITAGRPDGRPVQLVHK